MVDEKSTDSAEANAPDPLLLNERQVDAIERVAKHLAPDDVIEKRWRRFVAKTIGVVMFATAVVTGGWELATFAIENWQQRSTINTWIEVAREVYEDEGNGEVAKEFLSKVEEIDPQNAKLIRLAAYIDGMSMMEVLLNLDRPWNQDELNQADMAKAQGILLHKVDSGSPDGLILRAQVTAALKEYERAEQFLQDALKVDPKNDFAKVRLAMVRLQQADSTEDSNIFDAKVEEAEQLLNEAIKINPNSSLAAIWLGDLESNYKWNIDKAIEWYNKALSINPRYHLAHFSIGTLHLDEENYDDARASLEKTLELKPSYSKAFAQLGWLYGYQDLYETGLQYTRKANAIDPGFLEGWEVTGRLAWELGLQGDSDALAEANNAFSIALELDPTNPQWYYLRSEINLFNGDLFGAGKDARQAVRFGPDDARSHLHLGNYLLQINPPQYANAEASFQKALELEEDLDDARRNLALVLEEQGQISDSLAELEWLAKNSSADIRAINLVALGNFWLRQVDNTTTHQARIETIQNAENWFDKAIEDDPENFEAWLGSATVRRRTPAPNDEYDDWKERYVMLALEQCRMLRPDVTIEWNDEYLKYVVEE